MHLGSVEGYGVALYMYWNVAGCSLGSEASLFHRITAGWQEKSGQAPNLLRLSLRAASLSYHSAPHHYNEKLEKTNLKREIFILAYGLLGSIVSGPVERQSISRDHCGGPKCLTCGGQQGKGKGPGVSYHPKGTYFPGLCGPTLDICHFSAT